MHLHETTFFDLDLGSNETLSSTLLHVMTYEPAKFGVVMSNGLGEYAIARNMTDRRMTDRILYEIKTKEKSG